MSLNHEIFPPMVVRKLLGFSTAELRKLRKEVDPKDKERKNGFSHSALFSYSIFRTLIDNENFNVVDICKFDWTHIFGACELLGIYHVKNMALVYRHDTNKVWMVSIKDYDRLHFARSVRGLELAEAYEIYIQYLILRFEPRVHLSTNEYSNLLSSQPGYDDLLSTPIDIRHKERIRNANLADLMRSRRI